MDVNGSRKLRLFDGIDSIKCTLTSLGKKSKGFGSRHISSPKAAFDGRASVSTSQLAVSFSSQLPLAYAFDHTYVRPVAEDKDNNPFPFGLTHSLSSLSISTPVDATAPATPGNLEHTFGAEDLFFGHTTSEVNDITPQHRVRIAPASSETFTMPAKTDGLLETSNPSSLLMPMKLSQPVVCQLPANGPASINELMLASGEYTDATFITSDGKEIGAHQCFMALASPILKAAFARDGSVVHVSFPEDVTRLAIRYAYGCSVTITDKEAPALLKFAKAFGMLDLERECMFHIKEKTEVIKLKENSATWEAIINDAFDRIGPASFQKFWS